jgi:hypothetical protein
MEILRKICLLVVRPLLRPLLLPPEPLTLKRAGTTFAALSRASNVITQLATTIKPILYLKKRTEKREILYKNHKTSTKT